ncbi:putative Zn finger-like uncharacterized protein [Inhella inkyongensis]|uniref:Putative Zn finger-like uncharacterized protein n=1 Tax=Inhella inkyongensis TaxID=392593 RepID=A0A840S3S6_9BURK|nr:DUF3426 domain-containing protein [Inhella inkyongensis]MBB5203484.1 putative Zn finger-like uncharacterized protein [Inhella inkyongensis]
MSLATRCPSCATVFRVAEDQLRVSEGFVRCGRCDAVFNAREQLFDLDGEPAARQADPVPPMDPAPPPAYESAVPTPEETAPYEAEEFAATVQTDAEFEPDPHAEALEDGRREPSFSALGFGEDAAVDPNARLRELLGATEQPATKEVALAGAPGSAPKAESFASLRSPPSPRRSTWRQGLAWLSLALLVIGLPLQWAWWERDALRARWPWAEAAWLQACGTCSPVAWKRLEGLVVAASGLQPTPQGQAYHLSLRIENRNPHSLALPWVDLKLNDAEGRLLLRRSLSPQELGQKQQRIEAGASLDLGATFSLAGRLTGYEISLFHP